MTAKIWTLLISPGEVNVFYSLEAVEEAARQAVISYGPDAFFDYEKKYGDADFQITTDNWRNVLVDLNVAMKEDGEAGYWAQITEHELPKAKIAVVSNREGGAVQTIVTDSPLLDGAEVVVLESGFDSRDYESSDVMEMNVPGSTAGEFVGHRASVELADLEDVFAAVDAKDAGALPTP